MRPCAVAKPSDRLLLSETFESLQGEGASVGEPCLFVRLATCNLHCTWCDTRYTWDWSAYRYADEVHERSVTDVADLVTASGCRRVVITGGEPLVQTPALDRLLGELPPDLAIEIETNGTLPPSDGLLRRVDQWNVSPKLSNAGDPEQLRFVPEVLTSLRDTGRAWLKLVLTGDSDADEADALIARLDWPRSRVIFMPEAADRDALRARTPTVAAAALARGVRLGTRLHVELWGGKRGV